MAPPYQQGRNGGGFFINIILLIILIAVFVLSDTDRFPSRLPTLPLPRIHIANLKSAIATSIINISFSYIGANEYIKGTSQETSEDPIFNNEVLTILVLGMTGEGYISPTLTDSILAARLNLDEKRGVAISLPRDLLVKIPDSDRTTRINALYQLGLEEKSDDPTKLVKTKVEEITGFAIQRTLVIDLASLEQLVDALGGISVYIEKTIDDTRFPTPEGGYTIFRIEQGWQHLDGQTAANYVRTRHTSRGDIDRIARQQQVAAALREKISGLHPLFDFKTILDVLNSLKGHLKTDISPDEIKYLWFHQRDFSERDVTFRSIDAFEKNSFLISKTQILGGERASVLVPRTGADNYNEIKDFIKSLIKENN